MGVFTAEYAIWASQVVLGSSLCHNIDITLEILTWTKIMSRMEDTTEINIARLRIMMAVWQAEIAEDKRIIAALNRKGPLTRPETRVIKS